MIRREHPTARADLQWTADHEDELRAFIAANESGDPS